MKTLHILRKEPDELVKELMESFSIKNTDKIVPLYQGNVDWTHLVDDIFSHDKVICWW